MPGFSIRDRKPAVVYNNHSHHLHELYINERFADITVKGKDREWHLHKSQLSSLKYFDALFRAEPGGENIKEISVAHEDSEMIDLLLYSAYTACIFTPESDLPNAVKEWIDSQTEANKLERHLELVAFAARFDAIELVVVVTDHLETHIKAGLSGNYSMQQEQSYICAFLRRTFSDEDDAPFKSLRKPIITLVFKSIFNIREGKEFQALFADKDSTFGVYLIKALGDRRGE